MCLMKRLWEFHNGKMGVYRQKINQDTVKNVKDQIFKTYDKITDTLGKLKPWRDPWMGYIYT